MKSFLLPEFPNRIRHIFQEEIDKFALIVFKLTENRLGFICSFLDIEMKTLPLQRPHNQPTAQSPYLAPTSEQGYFTSDILQDSLNGFS